MADIAADERLLSILQDLIRIRSCEPGWDELDVVRYLESLFAPFSVQKNIIHQKLEEWIGTKYEQVDDILIMGFAYIQQDNN